MDHANAARPPWRKPWAKKFLKHARWHDEELRFYHYRDKDKVEVDIIIEQGRRLAGVEIKTAATITRSDFKGLNKLKEACGEQFAGGVLFYDGENVKGRQPPAFIPEEVPCLAR